MEFGAQTDDGLPPERRGVRVIAAGKPVTVCSLAIAVAIFIVSSGALAQAPAAKPAPSTTTQQTVDYKKKLAAYLAVRNAFDEEADAYWLSITEKRKVRNAKRRNGQTVVATDYVLTQPPVYAGPPMPVDPSGGPPPPAPPRAYIPVVADFLNNAREHFQFTPRKPASEIEFKKAYARAASAAGITKDQAVRIYGFESGGNGKYDIQSGIEGDRPNARAISTALGYNQLVTTNSTSLLAAHSAFILKSLKDKAAQAQPPRRQELERTIAIVQRMIAFCKTIPLEWYAHEKLSVTPQGLGVHTLNLDTDVGPLLQALKLTDSINFARRKGFAATLSAAELEMMNLTGDGNGFDIVSMPQAMRPQIPTSNFFLRRGYERNPVASRNNTVSRLLAATDAKMDKEVAMQGAKDLAAAF